MTRLLKALLCAGLFFANFANSADYDPSDSKPAKSQQVITCNASYWGEALGSFSGSTFAECVSNAAPAINAKIQLPPAETTLEKAGGFGTITTTRTFTALTCTATTSCSVGYRIDVKVSETSCAEQNGTLVCVPIPDRQYTEHDSGVVKSTGNQQGHVCPPDGHQKYTIGPIEVNSVKLCYKPLEPIDCSALQGIASSSLYDKFRTHSSSGYSKTNQPSCVTRCATDENGIERCGDCKVAAGSWSMQQGADGTQVWWPNAGTFTGDACSANEKEVPPPEPTKCWETKNGLNMCVQDPAEKCVVVNGVQQCESGCGTINGAFYCADKDTTPKVDPNSKDKPVPEPDDNISDPTKSINDMQKQDFKDVQKGVESRIVGVGTAVGNVENSVDSVNESIKDLIEIQEDSLEQDQAQTDQLGEINAKLDSIGSGGGDGDGEGEGEGGECDPNKNPDCVGDDGVGSWWNSTYPEGLSGVFQEKLTTFQASDVYQSLTQPLTLNSSGARPAWNFCFNFGFADFGCEELSIPDFIWHFIKACMLFGAAILCRRMLIGA